MIFDEKSKIFFLENVGKIKDDINRMNVWRILCDNIKVNNVSGEELINCVIENIVDENEEYTLPVILSAVSWALKYKINSEGSLL